MTQAMQVNQEQALGIIKDLIGQRLTDSNGQSSRAVFVSGPPRSGKTTVASKALLLALNAFGDGAAKLVVSGRHAADRLSRDIIMERGSSSQMRPVGTLQALAFQLVSVSCRLQDERPQPKLLNGAEQDALLRSVLAIHVAHAQAGDECSSCRLLEQYFANQIGWAEVLNVPSYPVQSLSKQIDDAFIVQLRDTISRMSELGLSPSDQGALLDSLSQQNLDLDVRDRLSVQWRLVFVLWKEYMQQIGKEYPGEYRLDSSQLLIAGRNCVVQDKHITLPKMLIVDDWQDLTIAGMSFVQALWERGVLIVLVGNSDESLQTFRGSYPEFLADRVGQFPLDNVDNEQLPVVLPDNLGRLGAVCLTLPYRPIVKGQLSSKNESETEPEESGSCASVSSYADLLNARISLSIRSEHESSEGLFDRAGKMPHWEHTMPVTLLEAGSALRKDGSVSARLFQQVEQEEDDIIWQIKHEFLSGRRDWNDMAVIAHDNATVQAIGQRLRVEGVPVRYSSIVQPLKDVPAVRGLFALIALAQERSEGLSDRAQHITQEHLLVLANHIRTLLSSPLIEAQLSDRQTARPVQVSHIDTLLDVIVSLTRIGDEETANQHDGVDSSSMDAIRGLQQQWATLVQESQRIQSQSQVMSGVRVDDSLMNHSAMDASGSSNELNDGLTLEAIYALILHDGTGLLNVSNDSSKTVKGLRQSLLSVLEAIANTHEDADLKAFGYCLRLIDTTALRLQALENNTSEYILWQAWQAAGLAEQWQTQALEASLSGEQANDRLDAMMRLFEFAASTQVYTNIDDFIAQVEGMQIEADSLAHVGPVEHAVTLTTPAGAAALEQTWPVVWLPTLQEGIWPNLAPRDTLFGGEELSALVLYGVIHEETPDGVSHNTRLKNTLYAEEKSFLTAVSRAKQELRLSAVWNDVIAPSDFLYGFLPEFFPRVSDVSQATFTQVGTQDDLTNSFSGLEVGERGLVAAARSILAQWSLQKYETEHAPFESVSNTKPVTPEMVADATATLKLLSQEGVREADPANWAFLYYQQKDKADNRVKQQDESTSVSKVTLSPSAVDSIWSCPLEWAMSNQFSGPNAGTVAMSFGSLIHKVAQIASEQGLDRPDVVLRELDSLGNEGLIARTAESMMVIYRDLLGKLPSFGKPKDAYDIRRRDSQAQTILSNIASYFVLSALEGYGAQSVPAVKVGSLIGVKQEEPFRVSFTPRDITDIWNATYPEHRLTSDELFALESALVDGFPRALSLDTHITLSGRIDRLEIRQVDGRTVYRLVDYKTGQRKHTGSAIFNDLQLVCYQLGIAFASSQAMNNQSAVSKSFLAEAVPVSQAVLFDVAACSAPAFSRAPETVYQPALFHHGKFNTVFEPRYYLGKLSRLFTIDLAGLPVPDGVQQSTWEFVQQVCVSDQGIWALTMISRVLFAAGVKLSAGLQDAVFDAEHCQKKNSKGHCQAWESVAGTVLEDNR